MANTDYVAFSNEETDGTTSSLQKKLVPDVFTGPVEKRRRTNVEFLISFIIFIIVWLSLSFYCVANGDLNRLHIPAGVKNSTLGNESEVEYIEDLKSCFVEICLSCAAAIGFSILLIVLLRHYAGVVVWFVLGLKIAGLTIGTVLFWCLWAQENDAATEQSSNTKATGYLEGAVGFTIATIIVSLVIYAMRKNIKLTIILFTEGGKAAQTMPLIMLQPFVTLLAVVASLCLAVYFALIIESSGFPENDPHTGNVTYRKNGIMLLARGYNIVATLWIMQFLNGCQYMVIAGAVVTWFFSRDKSCLRNVLSKSYRRLFKFHLGSVAFGSFIITTVKILRFIYKMISKRDDPQSVFHCICNAICKMLESFITFLTKNAYIEMAIYGDDFWKSGKRAFHVVTNNAVKLATINSVGDWVMVTGRLIVTACSVGVGYLLIKHNESEVHETTLPLIVIGIFAFVVSNAFMTVFETIVDSVFICFCEDCDMNDGEERPYYMSKALMVFINKD